jgi:glycosyltransferase involved in cell wall biosynthesis
MKKVIVRGPALSRSGYGEHARFLLRALRSSGEFDIYLINTPWGSTSWRFEDDEERDWIDSLLLKTIDAGATLKGDVSIQVTVPNEWVRIAPKNIGVTAGIETDRISDSWIRGTHIVDKIIVPSNHSKSGFVNAKTNVKDPLSAGDREVGVTTPIDVVSFPSRNIQPRTMERFDKSINTSFNFLTVAQISPRKNIESSLVAFLEEFHNEEDVGYVLKLSIKNNSLIDRENTKAAIQSLLQNFPDRKCKVHLLHGNLNDEEMAGLYASDKIGAYVSASHGEGFGLPIFEAAQGGVPIIAPEWSGYTDFTSFKPTVKSKKEKSYIVGVDYKVSGVQPEAVWNGVIEKDTKWCFTDLQDLKVKMRSVYSDTKKYQKNAKKLQTNIKNNFSEEKQNSLFINSIKEIL